MPSSASDRFTVDWETIAFFTKNGRYWFDQQFEETLTFDDSVRDRDASKLNNCPGRSRMAGLTVNNYTQRNMRTVWHINTQPFKEAHFAVFPPELPRRCIKAGCPKDICLKCGKAREKVYEAINAIKCKNLASIKVGKTQTGGKTTSTLNAKPAEQKLINYSDCGCNAGFSKGIVLDPFMGSGTTGLIAKELGRDFIGIELNPDYIKMAEKRISEFMGLFDYKEVEE